MRASRMLAGSRWSTPVCADVRAIEVGALSLAGHPAIAIRWLASGHVGLAADEPVAAANVVNGRLADPKLLGDPTRRQAFLSGLDDAGLIGIFKALHLPVVGAVRGLEPGLEGLGVVAIDPTGLL